MSSEFPDCVVHGLRGLDHCHVPCIGNDPRLRLLHGPRQPVSTRYRRRRAAFLPSSLARRFSDLLA
jgi:hypothetical protein